VKLKIIIPIWVCLAIIAFVISYLICYGCTLFIGIPLFIMINAGIGTALYLVKMNSKKGL
jgi:hypothetical protein